MNRKLTPFLAFIVISHHVMAAQDLAGHGKSSPRSLQSANIGQRVKARSRILNERRSLIRSLVVIAGSDDRESYEGTTRIQNWNTPKHLAILLLGELRAEKGIRILTQNLTYRVTPLVGGVETGALASQFPAARSLAQIGNPAVPAILRILRTTKTPLERQICAWILVEIDGRHVAKFRVANAIKQCSLSIPKANLEAATKYFDKEDLDFPPPEQSENTEDK